MRNRGVYWYKRRRVNGWPIWVLRFFKREIRREERQKKRLLNEMRVLNQITLIEDQGEMVLVSLV